MEHVDDDIVLVGVCVADSFADFQRDFRNSNHYTTSRRGALPVKKNVHAANTCVKTVMDQVQGRGALNGLSAAERSYVQAPGFFGYNNKMQAAGPEHAFVASLKLQTHGARNIVCCSFPELAKYAQTTGSTGQVWTLHDLSNLLAQVLQFAL